MKNEFFKNYSLENKKALVLGSSFGIGKSSAEFLASQGAEILLVARNKKILIEVKNNLTGKNHKYFAADLGFETEQEKLIEEIKNFGIPEIILINWNYKSKPEKLTKLKLNEDLITKETSLILKLIQICIPYQKEKKFGRWIGISSMISLLGGHGQGIYSIQKNSLESILKTLAIEVGKYGITSNIISPGFILTENTKSNLTEKQIKTYSKMNLLERAGTPEEIAHAVSFLSSPLASYINGINLPICAGLDLNWGLNLFLKGEL